MKYERGRGRSRDEPLDERERKLTAKKERELE